MWRKLVHNYKLVEFLRCHFSTVVIDMKKFNFYKTGFSDLVFSLFLRAYHSQICEMANSSNPNKRMSSSFFFSKLCTHMIQTEFFYALR